ncbi:MAG TPA: hypothetical protein DIU39_00505 [Flavobacteriales bacterium]|nr:hypothetical protein [Flavobacteriales bacterium]|tara:strand:+ start:10086 stop:12551 length:2466 start_codon:yes stop_codon:yes gene_type:complete
MKKNYILASVLSILSISYGFGQTILITDPDFDQNNPLDCNTYNNGSVTNFQDGGGSGNYLPNSDDTIVLCPDLVNGSKVTLAFGINAGFTFDVDGSDSIYVWDGPNTSSPLLGVHNSVTDPTGFTHQASFANNPSGCLTVRFWSDAAVEGTGWDANVSCGNPPQPFIGHIRAEINGNGVDALNPPDTGYVDICFEDSILFIASGEFPYSSDVTGTGYSQNNNNVTFQWSFSDGTQATGDSVWFKPPNRSGYLVTLKITDQFPQSVQLMCKVRVSTIPSFAGVMPLEDTLCLGETTELIGGVTPADTVGVDPIATNFELGGTYAGLTYLPDGSGQNYTTSINISGFDTSQTIQAASDIQKLCVTMEHSYLGDLEMVLSCPNGTTVTIFNSYSGSGGLIPGGFGGGGTYLGDAYDNNIGNPGIGWEYCWSSTMATLGDFPTEFASGNFIPTTISSGQAMDTNGIYLPEQSFANFVGCPINGNWTITVRDNLSIDDGYIFEWGIFFDPSINPNNETYSPLIVSDQWLSDPTIISGQNDTAIVIRPDTTGYSYYTFQVTDNFGCTYDTTVSVFVYPTPQVPGDTAACNKTLQVNGVTAAGGGVWTYTSQNGGSATFTPDSATLNPNISTSDYGYYNFVFTDEICNQKDTMTVFFAQDVSVSIDDAVICKGDTVQFNVDQSSVDANATYSWNTGETTPVISVYSEGEYIITINGTCNTVSDNALIEFRDCELVAPNVITPNDGNTLNNYLIFKNLDFYPNSSLVVYNRWGKKVYESSNYQNDWDGKNQNNGKPLNSGTYFYILTPGGNLPSEPIKGNVTIINNGGN